MVDAVPEGEVAGRARSMSSDSASAYRSVVAVGGGQQMITWAPAGIVTPADGHRLGRVPEGRVGHRRVEAQELLDGRGDLGGIGAQPAELVGVAEQRDDAVADEAGRRVVPGDDQLEDRRQQLAGCRAARRRRVRRSAR